MILYLKLRERAILYLKLRERAMAILNRLKAYPNVISWDNTGQVKLDNKDQIFQIF